MIVSYAIAARNLSQWRFRRNFMWELSLHEFSISDFSQLTKCKLTTHTPTGICRNRRKFIYSDERPTRNPANGAIIACYSAVYHRFCSSEGFINLRGLQLRRAISENPKISHVWRQEFVAIESIPRLPTVFWDKFMRKTRPKPSLCITKPEDPPLRCVHSLPKRCSASLLISLEPTEYQNETCPGLQ